MMTTTFPKYESYKDSGVDWIGAIPAHWGLKKNKFLLTEKKNTVGKNSSNFTLLSLTLQGVIARDMENPQGKFPAEFNTYKIVKPDDLIFCLFDVEETPRTVGHANQTGMITGAYEIFECGSEIDSRYFYYYYLSLDFDKRLQPLYSGLRKVIKIDAFLGTKSPIPSIEEQKRIVEFLDRTTTDIDRAIAQKQRLIELLQEQKAIVINQAVTKGLNPNVPMRDSGIEAIGEIPEHWQVTRLKRLFLEIDDRSTNGSETLLSLRMYAGLVPHNDVSDKPIEDTALVGYKRVYPGQIVMNRMRAAIGLFGVAKIFGIVSPDYAVFRQIKDLKVDYYLNLFKTELMKKEFLLESKGLGTGSSGFLRLYSDKFGMRQFKSEVHQCLIY